MDGLNELLILGGSLFAIFVIFCIARLLGLGRKPDLRDADCALVVAQEVESGFEAKRVSISAAKDAALLKSEDGRIMLIKRHGGHFVGRILTGKASAQEEVDALIVNPSKAEQHFGSVRLRLDDAASWADAINRL
ncbi:MAG: hypothetical protein AAGL10_16310 [Pseudomonadota bacterium]